MAKKSTKAEAAELLAGCDASKLRPMKLSPSAIALMKAVEAKWVLHEPARLLLRTCAESLTRSEAASAVLERDGLTVTCPRTGAIKQHCCVTIERDARGHLSLTMQKLLLSLSSGE